MRITAIFLFFTMIGLFISASVFHATFPAAVAPDFILILGVALAFYFPGKWGLLLAFSLGVLGDFASAQYLGPNAAGLVVAFCLVGMISNRLYADRFIALMILTFICSLAKSLTIFSMYFVFLPDKRTIFYPLFQTILLEALITAIMSPIVLALLRSNKEIANSSFAIKPNNPASYRLSSKS